MVKKGTTLKNKKGETRPAQAKIIRDDTVKEKSRGNANKH